MLEVGVESLKESAVADLPGSWTARVHGGAAEPTVPDHNIGRGSKSGVRAVVCSAMCRRSRPESAGDGGGGQGISGPWEGRAGERLVEKNARVALNSTLYVLANC
jgi:hypothetical protein